MWDKLGALALAALAGCGGPTFTEAAPGAGEAALDVGVPATDSGAVDPPDAPEGHLEASVGLGEPPDAQSHEATIPEAGVDSPGDDAPATVTVGGYTGLDAGNGCVVFPSTWCGGGITTINGMGVPNGHAYVCPTSATKGPPGSCTLVNMPSDATLGWCCS